jgi:single-strand DNA-binding protein
MLPEETVMASVNKAIILGRLGKDPELRRTPSGQAVVELRVATDESWTDQQGQKQERTEWHSIVVWGRQAENCERYLTKGREVFAEGRIQTREYTDKDGNTRYRTEIVADRVQFVGGRGEGAAEGGSRGGGMGRSMEGRGGPAPGMGDDLPPEEDLPF